MLLLVADENFNNDILRELQIICLYGRKHLMSKLGRNELQEILKQVEDSFPLGTCNTCECFLGYLAQLRIDSDPGNKELFLPFKVDRKDMHHCLGCDPCPPGDLYAEYMKKKQIAAQ